MPMPQTTEISSRWFVRDEIRKMVLPLVDLSPDAFEIVQVSTPGLRHNWDIQFKAGWTGANPEAHHRHAQAVAECAARVQWDHPLVEFDE
ncbi:hypothetical protein [Xanthobacter autotrophicus]|uniref:Uncharacterized protein n=1 Tax=Xanthobacter autotrophicus TaxID=280 RepID=A0A6C1KJQ4_XANAU|nr:hypothetical protein [Xanthobacter autotrophicus]TLX43867.1 hypothetical protein FBQ73_07140 [Xanthobacter autotrophicus]